MENCKAITDDIVRYVARLSRLSLDEGETARFRGQLGDILGYVEHLKTVDTGGTPPTTHVLSSMKNVFRDDVPKASLTPEEALFNAPDKSGDLFKVPRVIKDN